LQWRRQVAPGGVPPQYVPCATITEEWNIANANSLKLSVMELINEINHDRAFAKRWTLCFPGSLSTGKHRNISEFRERIKSIEHGCCRPGSWQQLQTKQI
jgi:hypothetical protein